MRAGRLRHRLHLQEQTETQNAYGEAVISWTTTATCFGSLEPFYGYTKTSTDQQIADLALKVIIRYGSEWSSIDTTWRVKDANTDRCYDIRAVIQYQVKSRVWVSVITNTTVNRC